MTYGVYIPGDAGEEVSSTYEGRHLTFNESQLVHPVHTDGLVDKGDPILVGEIVGVAFMSAVLTTDLIPVDTEGIWQLSVVATNEDGNSAVAVGDALYINRTTAIISKDKSPATQALFGYALYPITSGETDVIPVKVHFDPSIAVDKDLLADEVTYNEYVCISGALDNATYDTGKLANDCEVVAVDYFTVGAAGSGAGIDIVDGGADGSGSAVIDASADNLDGVDCNTLSTPYAMASGEHLKVKVDDVSSTFVFVKITLKVKVNSTE
jgi:hypothetical protein